MRGCEMPLTKMVIIGLDGLGIPPAHVRDERLTSRLTFVTGQRLEFMQRHSDKPVTSLVGCNLQMRMVTRFLPVRVKGSVGVGSAGVGEKQRSRIWKVSEMTRLRITLAALRIHIVA